jgi:type IV pilus assembly protein PilQ
LKKNNVLWLVFLCFVMAAPFAQGVKKMSLHFQNISVRSALQLLSRTSGHDIILADNIKGTISLNLSNKPWRQVLDLILASKNLSAKTIDGVTLVKPSNLLEKEQQQRQKLTLLFPLQLHLFKLHYALATQIAALLKTTSSSLLSKRASVGVDKRTNTLIVRDTAPQMKKIKIMIHALDAPIKQVMINARVVNIDDNDEKELGLQFGQRSTQNTPAGQTQRLTADIPTIANGAGHFGLALFKLTQGTQLDLELSALELEGHAEIISSPRLMTADRQTAIIEAGQEIPYQQTAGEGATSVVFKKALLRLQARPQVIPGGRIRLQLTVNQDAPSAREVRGVPAIDTRRITTQVLVNNGQTIVLGGIYEHEKSHQISRVPFLGRLPLLGALFRTKKQVDTRRELLIFVTPKIME